MKVLVTGSNGMLGSALVRECKRRDMEVSGLDLSGAEHTVDLTDDEAVAVLFAAIQPDVVINCAAIIDVALCDSNPLLAWRVNARLLSLLAGLSREHGAKLVQISTDHYFAGDGALLHDEQAAVTFFNEYARTKFAGEAFALTIKDSLVLRTNIVGFRGHGRPTFAEWAFGAVEKDQKMTLFQDSFVSCIDIVSFGRAVMDLAQKNETGLLNVASREVFSKKDFIEMIAEVTGNVLSQATAGSVSTLQVRRADSCGLDVTKAESVLGYNLPTLRETVVNLVEQRRGIDADQFSNED